MSEDGFGPAICRGCRQVLRGKAYCLGGSAYHPRTGERCKVNHYGGFVCSPECDRKASLEQLRDMPNCGGAAHMDCYAAASQRANWPEYYR